jgi:hypothetical protein
MELIGSLTPAAFPAVMLNPSISGWSAMNSGSTGSSR